MGEGIPGDHDSSVCVCIQFFGGESFPCLDSPEGCQEGAGMWVRTTLELDNGA